MKRRTYSPGDRDYIRQHYQRDRSVAQIAEDLTTTTRAVRWQARRLGLGRQRALPFTSAEDQYILQYGQRLPLTTVARRLHKSVPQVSNRARHLHLSLRVRDGWYTKEEAAQVVGMRYQGLQHYINCGALRATHHHATAPAGNGGGAYHIAEKDLREFVRQYPSALQGRPVDMVVLVDLLAGVVV